MSKGIGSGAKMLRRAPEREQEQALSGWWAELRAAAAAEAAAAEAAAAEAAAAEAAAAEAAAMEAMEVMEAGMSDKRGWITLFGCDAVWWYWPVILFWEWPSNWVRNKIYDWRNR